MINGLVSQNVQTTYVAKLILTEITEVDCIQNLRRKRSRRLQNDAVDNPGKWHD